MFQNKEQLGFLLQQEVRGRKLVITVSIESGSSENPSSITSPIDLAYIEPDGRAYVRDGAELWNKAYTMRCPQCHGKHRLPLSVVNALIPFGEAVIKSFRALNSHTLDDVNMN